MTIQELLKQFTDSLQLEFQPSSELEFHANDLMERLHNVNPLDEDKRVETLFALINGKFRLNAEHIARFLTFAAVNKVTLDYHDKKEVSAAFDLGDAEIWRKTILKRKLPAEVQLVDFETQFAPISRQETLNALHRELKTPTLVRKDSKPKDWSKDILSSLFGAFVYSSMPEQAVHGVLDPLNQEQHYEEDFWQHLHKNLPHLFSRHHTLSCFRVNQDSLNQHVSRSVYRNTLRSALAAAHADLANHGHVALLIDALKEGDQNITWELYSEIVLYAEKHLDVSVDQGFIKYEKIRSSTLRDNPEINIEEARFDRIHLGLFYLDCFVLGNDGNQKLLVIFQKHQPDETLIPCPTCRSHKVQGNSYSSLGVKSWECDNPLCPDRSKFNRGKRYSFLQLLKQRGLQNPDNMIEPDHVRRWARDVQPIRSDVEILDFLVRHYSLYGDGIQLHDWQDDRDQVLGRHVNRVPTSSLAVKDGLPGTISAEDFDQCSFFARYIGERQQPQLRPHREETITGTRAILGDSFDVLAALESASIDGAVTSPPYYNAREYSQWTNIYTYLYDMYNVARQVYRVLKPGGYYLFNIFDYFDNENIVAQSAMGNKRLILGAYTVDFFKRAGFACVGNIVWDKGDIEGKRGFNQGNFTPYYQAPFNCWEHVFVFQKPPLTGVEYQFPRLIRLKPVIKMVRGQNTHGHTAPFPEGLPDLLACVLAEKMTLLDPYAGSMTTGAVALQRGLHAVCIEKDEQYFALGVSKLQEVSPQLQFL